jgi:DNA-binding GntR family transcriptional regulator
MNEEASGRAGKAPRLFEKVYLLLRERMNSGAIGDGTVLRESVIADELAISRAPVRRALERLQAEGLLAPHGAARVATITSQRPIAAATQFTVPQPLTSEASWERILIDVEAKVVARMSFGSWRLIESDLARHYGVSRTVAREVLARLQQRGIVKKDARSHWYVPGLGPEYMAELYELRWTLEPVALKNAAAVLPDGLAARCLANLDRAIANADTLDGPALDALETELHVQILGYCGNATLTEALRLYQSLLIAHSFLYRTAPRVFASEPFLPEHRAILAPLAAGHPEEAASALERHLRVSLDRAVTRVRLVKPLIILDDLSFLIQMEAG